VSARRVLPALGVGIRAGVALAGEALLAPVTAWAVAAVAEGAVAARLWGAPCLATAPAGLDACGRPLAIEV